MGKYLDKNGLAIVISNLKKYIDKRINAINITELMPPIRIGSSDTTASATNKPGLLYWNYNDFTWRTDTVGSSTNGVYLKEGALTATGSSDIALKQDINSVSKENIDKIDNVEIKQFCFKDTPDIQKIGVIAQEVEKAGLDNLVFIDTNTYKFVDYQSLFALKIKSLEEKNRKQQEEINDLKSQINEIKNLLKNENGES